MLDYIAVSVQVTGAVESSKIIFYIMFNSHNKCKLVKLAGKRHSFVHE